MEEVKFTLYSIFKLEHVKNNENVLCKSKFVKKSYHFNTTGRQIRWFQLPSHRKTYVQFYLQVFIPNKVVLVKLYQQCKMYLKCLARRSCVDGSSPASPVDVSKALTVHSCSELHCGRTSVSVFHRNRTWRGKYTESHQSTRRHSLFLQRCVAGRVFDLWRRRHELSLLPLHRKRHICEGVLTVKSLLQLNYITNKSIKRPKRAGESSPSRITVCEAGRPERKHSSRVMTVALNLQRDERDGAERGARFNYLPLWGIEGGWRGDEN